MGNFNLEFGEERRKPVITFFDLIQDNDFRAFVEKRLIREVKNSTYLFPKVFPKLYKYRPMSKFAVDDILNGRITATSIGEFNDLFDGAIHYCGTNKEISHFAEEKWMELEKICTAARLPNLLLEHDSFVSMYSEHLKTESKLKFRNLDYLGTYVCCLSSKYDSTLMWAHYANSNTGICLEYDFNDEKIKPLLKKMLFPIAYSQKPVDLRDLLSDDSCQKYKYSFDSAVLCAALNKAMTWNYEYEWRLVYISPVSNNYQRRLSLELSSAPKSIALGYHFLKLFFYYNYKNQKEYDLAKEHLVDMMRLLGYMKTNQIPVVIMAPSIGNYSLIRKNVDIDSLIQLINCYFEGNEPEDMQYYYVVHDELMNLLEG
ncbi:DUF2971 domain-containing protein [[Clostridium] spiroforme]|nr:DUF2971 domain-containing protein [Thomasclavelia spiroformis]MBM6879536.1 DUF2971 domain-containing protein [Thomasclavelia spiroformis]